MWNCWMPGFRLPATKAPERLWSRHPAGLRRQRSTRQPVRRGTLHDATACGRHYESDSWFRHAEPALVGYVVDQQMLQAVITHWGNCAWI